MTPEQMTRRDLLRRLGLTGAALAIPGSVLAACGGSQGGTATDMSLATNASPDDLAGTSIKVATFGGFFEENFKEIYPDFTADTGIEVESVSEPGGDAWVGQLEQAVRSGGVPADVSLLGIVSILRAMKGGVVMAMDEGALTNLDLLADGFVRRNDNGDVVGVGAASWYITLVSNTNRVPESPTSWATLWDERWRNELAMNNQPASSFLLDIAAHTFFADEADTILTSLDGAREVLAKVAEIKPNVKLWWRDEATAQQDYNSGEVSIGEFYHDITTYAASTGEPLRSVFPEEGAVLDSGMWAITRTTEQPAACVAFIDWMTRPEVQARLSTTLGTSPTLALEHLDLSDADYEAVSGPGPDAAIKPAYELYQSYEDELSQLWAEQIFSG